jgi:hypothetical protein
MRAWRLEAKANDELKSREPPSTPAPLSKLPWDLAKDEFGTKGVEFIASLGRVLLHVAKTQNKTNSVDYTKESDQHLGRAANDSKRGVTSHPP